MVLASLNEMASGANLHPQGSIQPRPWPLAAQGHARTGAGQSGLAFRWNVRPFGLLGNVEDCSVS